MKQSTKNKNYHESDNVAEIHLTTSLSPEPVVALLSKQTSRASRTGPVIDCQGCSTLQSILENPTWPSSPPGRLAQPPHGACNLARWSVLNERYQTESKRCSIFVTRYTFQKASQICCKYEGDVYFVFLLYGVAWDIWPRPGMHDSGRSAEPISVSLIF